MRRPFLQSLVVVCALLTSVQAQQRPFTIRYEADTTGDILIIGNTLMTCPSAAANCVNARNGVGSGSALNNNTYQMEYVNIDPVAGNFNSSSARLDLPSGSTVLWAGLYWGGSPNVIQANKGQVRFRTPASGSYITITASQFDDVAGSTSENAYQGFREVTALVQDAGTGNYFVANVQTRTGTANAGNYAGWALVVVYNDPAQPLRDLTVFDGFVSQGASASPITITVSGFRTPTSGTFQVRQGIVAYEGDLGSVGDSLRLNNTNLGNAQRPSNNFFNSSISNRVPSRNPNYVNQLGFDVGSVALTGGPGQIIGNNASSANLTFVTSGDGYFPGVLTFAIEEFRPIFTGNVTKTVTNVGGTGVVPGSVLEYTINVRNAGNDTATNVVLTDPIPANTSFVPGSLQVTAGANVGAKSDQSGDDQAEFSSANNRVVFRLGTGASATAGGSLSPDATTSVRFRVRVNDGVAADAVIANQATLTNSAATGGGSFTTLSDGDPNTAGAQTTDVVVSQLSIITGTVFADSNYGGGPGRSLSGSQGTPRPGARVELYTAAGAFVQATTSDVNGVYTFGSLPGGTYNVRVVNSTVTSPRSGGTTPGLLAVQTFRTDAASGSATPVTNRVGGALPSRVDAGANTTAATLASLTTTTTTPSTTAQSLTAVALANQSIVAGVDFGFTFSTVVNTNPSGQGSLAQFITNSNALGKSGLAQVGQPAGRETSIFMIPTASDPLGRPADPNVVGGVATITLTGALPVMTLPNVSIDGTTQTSNIGDTNPGQLFGVNRPEVQLVRGVSLPLGLDVQASNTVVRGVAVYGFGSLDDDSAHANVRVGSVGNVLLEQLILGSSATAFTDPGATARTVGSNLVVTGGSGGTLRTSLVGFAGGRGVWLTAGATGWLVETSRLEGNGLGNATLDGIDIGTNSNAVTVRGNTIVGNRGAGVGTNGSLGANLIQGNTISGNGLGNVETAGVRLFGVGNVVRGNTVGQNRGAGVLVTSGSGQNIISQNSMADNGQLGIDLLTASDNPQTGSSPFVTPNRLGGIGSGGNALLNFPILESATLSSGTLTLTGFARPNAVLELFVAAPDPSGFGEGEGYLLSLTEGSATDTDTGTGSYSSPVNGLNQGTDSTNRFRFVVPAPAGVTLGSVLTATATLNQNTSEFSGNVTVTAGQSVSGVVFDDANANALRDTGEAGLAGVTVTLASTSSTLSIVATTAADGSYVFSGVPAGSYTVTVVRAGYLVTTPTPVTIIVAQANVTALATGLFRGVNITGSVFYDNGSGGGTANDAVRQGGEVGVAGVTVSATGGGLTRTAQTDADGSYSLHFPMSGETATFVLSHPLRPATGYNNGATAVTVGSYADAQGAGGSVTLTLAPGSYLYNFGVVRESGFSDPGTGETTSPGTIV